MAGLCLPDQLLPLPPSLLPSAAAHLIVMVMVLRCDVPGPVESGRVAAGVGLTALRLKPAQHRWHVLLLCTQNNAGQAASVSVTST